MKVSSKKDHDKVMMRQAREARYKADCGATGGGEGPPPFEETEDEEKSDGEREKEQVLAQLYDPNETPFNTVSRHQGEGLGGEKEKTANDREEVSLEESNFGLYIFDNNGIEQAEEMDLERVPLNTAATPSARPSEKEERRKKSFMKKVIDYFVTTVNCLYTKI